MQISSTKCPQCHASVEKDWAFCGDCGHDLKIGTPASTQPAATPQASPTIPQKKSNQKLPLIVGLLGVGAFAFMQLSKKEESPTVEVEETKSAEESPTVEVEETKPAFATSHTTLQQKFGITMVTTAAKGSVTMGSPRTQGGRDKDEEQRVATITQPFALSSTEITQGQWEVIMGSAPARDRNRNWGSNPGGDYDPCNQYGVGTSYPVHCISWYEAIEFTNRLSEKMGLEPAYTVTGTSVSWNRSASGYRLPTEAEWAYAARNSGKDTGIYQANVTDGMVAANPYGSDVICDIANVSNPSTKRQHKRWTKRGTLNCDDGWADLAHVAQRKPVGGLYDMTGNLWEWVWDGYTTSPSTSAPSSYSGGKVVLRGGAWQGPAADYRLANRYSNTPGQHSYFVGFRIAQNNDSPESTGSATPSQLKNRDEQTVNTSQPTAVPAPKQDTPKKQEQETKKVVTTPSLPAANPEQGSKLKKAVGPLQKTESASTSRRGSVRLGSPIIMGALDKSLIKRAISAKKLTDCYQKQLDSNPNLKGKIIVKFTITGNGSVSQAKTKSSSMKSSAVESCIISRFRSFKFPKPKNSGFVMVQYPLTFSSK